jgi:hypothetical protein
MGADVSRVRFDPKDDFASVVLQQGRVLLDADFNEFVDGLDRRLRAQVCDLVAPEPDPARRGVAFVPRLTPDGFRVRIAGGQLSIGRGRMYVDGLLAENHGGDPQQFDPLLAGRSGTTATAYAQQPYQPLPAPVPAGISLAYLDVWRREVTHVEDPSLVEVAVGVETTARTQTVWQVRLLPDVGDITCATADADVPGWLDVIKPSAGRLSTGTVAIDVADDPCALPPTGGYRGLENQTYRVEIHEGGDAGQATFKWSRDNASVTQPIVEMITPTLLRATSLGRDDVLRFSTGDWVEILDDHYELGLKPGVIRRVTVDDSARTIAFAAAIPADLAPADAADAAARHLRVRRWDQAGKVLLGDGTLHTDLDAGPATGVIPVPAGALTQVVLEHGIVVSFGAGPFRAGDFWNFAARTADTSVEILTDAPPLGVHHHYARLGVVRPPDDASDCREVWPAGDGDDHDCACTICVSTHPESPTLQAAIDAVRELGGGTICVARGVYDLGDGVLIDGAHAIRILGQGAATILVAKGTAITVHRSSAITLRDMAIVSGAEAAPAIILRSVASTTLEDLVVLSSYGADAENEPQGDPIGTGMAVELSGVCRDLALRRNVLVGPTGIGWDTRSQKAGLLGAGVRIEDNAVVCTRRGIDVGGRSAYQNACRITGNDVVGGEDGSIIATGTVLTPGALDVARNKILADGPGIVVGADAAVEGNTIGARRAPSGDGIVVEGSPLGGTGGHVRVLANRIHDCTGAGIVLRTSVGTFMVKQNVLANVGAGIVMEAKCSAEHVVVDNNELLDLAAGAENKATSAIALANAGSATVVGNTILRFAVVRAETPLAAVVVAASRVVRISGNVLQEIGGPDSFKGVAVGLLVTGPFDSATVSENSVRPTTVPRDGAIWHALLIQSPGMELTSLGGRLAVIPTRDGGAVVLTNEGVHTFEGRAEVAIVTSNTLYGGGQAQTCLVRVAGDVIADTNHFTHDNGIEEAVVLSSPKWITASTNCVRGGRSQLILDIPEGHFAAVGNIARGGTHLNSAGAGLPDPWQALNPTAP